MKPYKILLVVALASTLFVHTGTVKSVTIDEIPIPEVPKTTEQLVQLYSTKYKVSAKKMMDTIICENRDLDPTLQSGLRYKFSDKKRNIKIGERERSYGLVQIHLPDHPEVSYAQATDPEFSIDFMAKKFCQGHGTEWSCY